MKRLTLFVAIFFIALAGNINAQTDYGIKIAGVNVTSDNCNNITGAKISGSVSYNDGTKTLTLNDATIDGNIDFGYGDSRLENITITLVGENTMTDWIRSVSNTKTINGTGSLKGKCGIDCNNEKNTIIEDCTIESDVATGGWSWAMFGADGKLTIKNANISIEARMVAIGDFDDIELIGCEIVEPIDAQIIDKEVEDDAYTYAGKYICDAGGNVAKKVVIKKITNYGITIAGVKVTAANCNNITGEGITGSVSYNDESKTLTLNNATIEGRIYFGADSSRIEDIIITLVGENTITHYIGSVSGTKTINGTGSLKAGFISCYHEQNTIIEDCTIDLYDDDWIMFSGGDGDGSKLTIKNANLSAEAGVVAIGDFADIELIGCEIVEPVNAQIIDNEIGGYAGKYICNEDGTVAKKVVIKKLSGLNDIAQSHSISIYPNPATNEIVINNIANNELVEIFDITGKVVKRVVYNNKINVSDLLAGVYTIKVNNQTQKLVIE